MFKKWWNLQHIADEQQAWAPMECITLFGRPLCTMFFRAWGPFGSYEEAQQNAYAAMRGEIKLEKVNK